MNKLENIILSSLLLLNLKCGNFFVKNEEIIPFPEIKRDLLVRENAEGYESGHYKYILSEYDLNQNGKVDNYLFYYLNPDEMIISRDTSKILPKMNFTYKDENGFHYIQTLPNVIFFDPDETGPMDYIWVYDKKLKGYKFSKYNPK